MGRHHHHSDTSDIPFSYLIEKDDETYLVPGINLRSVGTIRDAQKWPKRDKRTDPDRLDMINYNLLSPYTIQKMLKAVDILKNLQAFGWRDFRDLLLSEYSYKRFLTPECVELLWHGN